MDSNKMFSSLVAFLTLAVENGLARSADERKAFEEWGTTPTFGISEVHNAVEAMDKLAWVYKHSGDVQEANALWDLYIESSHKMEAEVALIAALLGKTPPPSAFSLQVLEKVPSCAGCRKCEGMTPDEAKAYVKHCLHTSFDEDTLPEWNGLCPYHG